MEVNGLAAREIADHSTTASIMEVNGLAAREIADHSDIPARAWPKIAT